MDILLLIVGLGLILAGANFLTDGSAALAQRFRVPEFIIGLTVVAVGTSTPELVVSVLSAIGGQSDVAIGKELVLAALEDIRSKGLRVVPQCSFVEVYIRRHPEWADLVRTAESAKR